jgi:hypothetical protein
VIRTAILMHCALLLRPLFLSLSLSRSLSSLLRVYPPVARIARQVMM